MRRSQTINGIGFCFTAVVLVIVLITKFVAGAWIAIVAMGIIYFTMRAIHRHYDRVAREIAADEDDLVLPSRVRRSSWSPSCICRPCGRWRTRGRPGRITWRR